MSTQTAPDRKKVTTFTLRQKKERGEIFTMLTAYDYATALAVDRAGIDVILVGDSLGMVVLGYDTTLPVTMDDMIHHAKAVARGAKNPLLVGDMPFMSYQTSVPEALHNAGRFLKEAQMDAVKLEGGRKVAEVVEALNDAGIPVMGHIGLTPQSIHKLGGFRVQGKTARAARRLVEDAQILEQAGCFSIVLEGIPEPVAELITHRLSIPTIGIGAGKGCDAQVLVTHDLLGLFDRFTPKFVKKYANLNAEMIRAFTEYKTEVEQRAFPTPEQTYPMDQTELAALLEEFRDELAPA